MENMSNMCIIFCDFHLQRMCFRHDAFEVRRTLHSAMIHCHGRREEIRNLYQASQSNFSARFSSARCDRGDLENRREPKSCLICTAEADLAMTNFSKETT